MMCSLTRSLTFVGLLLVSSAPAMAQATAEQLDAIAKQSAEQFDMQKEVFKESKEWLKSEKHTVGNDKVSRADFVKLIDDLYTAGATRVYFTAIMSEGDVEKAPALMLIVGGAPAVRTKVFDTVNAFNKKLFTAAGKPELIEALKQPDAGQPILQMQFEF